MIFANLKRAERELSLTDSDSTSFEMLFETATVEIRELRIFDANFATPTPRKRVLRTT